MASPTRNPIQPRPQKIQGPKFSKFDIGTLETDASRVGPTIQKPNISKDRQDAIPSKAGSATKGRGENPKVIDREYIPGQVNYGIR